MKRTTYSILAIALSAACGPPPSDLTDLNEELRTKALSEALASSNHFSPLCDAAGYPLVGNINGKVATTATEFCAALREARSRP